MCFFVSGVFPRNQGKDLWLQGMITLETVYVEYRADVHVFDHHVHERFHYQVSPRGLSVCRGVSVFQGGGATSVFRCRFTLLIVFSSTSCHVSFFCARTRTWNALPVFFACVSYQLHTRYSFFCFCWYFFVYSMTLCFCTHSIIGHPPGFLCFIVFFVICFVS